MATFFQRPENAVKRARELVEVDQPLDALNVLHASISHRRLRSQGWDPHAEECILFHIRLCLKLDKLKTAREGLHFYKQLAQQHNAAVLTKAAKYLRELSEAKLEATKAVLSSEGATADVKDLDAQESPEALILSTVQVDVKDIAAKKLHSALFACWESYKIILDLLRTVPKVEALYHETAKRALLFCGANKRVVEFRRLCENLRNHYANFIKQRSRPDFEVFTRPENHLATRLVQLQVAASLNLWSQCFQSAEDIMALGLHEILQRSTRLKESVSSRTKSTVLSQSASFYEKLAMIFRVSSQPLFHAPAMIRSLLHTRQYKKTLTEADRARLCDLSTVAVLCVPILEKPETPSELEYKRKLAAMLPQSVIPTRESMKELIETREILSASSPEVQELYHLVEGFEHPMGWCVKIEDVLKKIEHREEFTDYIPCIKRVVFDKLLLKLSKLYLSLSIDFFIEFFCPESFIPWIEAEHLIVQLVQQQLVQLRLDYSRRAILLGTASSAIDYSNLRQNLGTMSKTLFDLLPQIGIASPVLTNSSVVRNKFYENFAEKLQVEAQRVRKRNAVVSSRRKKQEEEVRAKEEAQRAHQKEQIKKGELEEQLRRENAMKHQEELRRRDEQRQKKHTLATQIVAELKQLADRAPSKIVVKGKPIDAVTPEDIIKYDFQYSDYEKAQEELRIKERGEKARQRRLETKRFDHFIRALREEELPTKMKRLAEVVERDQTLLAAAYELDEKEARRMFEENKERRLVLLRYTAAHEAWRSGELSARTKTWEEKKAERLEKFRAYLKGKKIDRARKRRATALEEQKRLEEERRQREREERRIREEVSKRGSDKARHKENEIEERQRSNASAVAAAMGAVSSGYATAQSGPLRPLEPRVVRSGGGAIPTASAVAASGGPTFSRSSQPLSTSSSGADEGNWRSAARPPASQEQRPFPVNRGAFSSATGQRAERGGPMAFGSERGLSGGGGFRERNSNQSSMFGASSSQSGEVDWTSIRKPPPTTATATGSSTTGTRKPLQS